MALPDSKDEPIVIAPELDGLVSRSGDELVSTRGDVKTRHLGFSSVDDPNGATVVGVPVGNLEVTAASQVLGLVRVD